MVRSLTMTLYAHRFMTNGKRPPKSCHTRLTGHLEARF